MVNPTRKVKEFVMGKMGKYVYGIIHSGMEETFDLDEIVAFEDIYPISTPSEVMENSKSFNKAYTICFRDISAVVSDSEIVSYAHMPKETLARLLVRHQEVIERTMLEHTIIPMRLGTFAESDEKICQLLSKGYRTIKDIFERSEKAIEIDVVVTLNDFNSFLREVSQEYEIRHLKQSLMTKKEGITFDDQMKLGVLVKKYSDEKKTELASQIQSVLSEIAREFKPHDLMDDKMILNTAFLIDKNMQKEFEHKVDELNDIFEDRLNFRCVGPLPPYSFYTLEVKRLQFKEIDWARKTLGLTDDIITVDKIKNAHRRSALTYHPDKNLNKPEIGKKFNEMTRAYRILLDYYSACDRSEKDEGYYINKETFEDNAVLVTTMG